MKSRIKSYEPGEIIYSPFATSEKVFIVTSGYVFASTTEDDGKKRIHLVYGPNAYFPVLSTFHGSNQRASYETVTSVTAECIDRKDFLNQVATDLKYCQSILAKTVDQLGIFAERIIDLQKQSLEDRLLTRINSLAREFGEGKQIPFKLKQHHFADMLGVERESITRAMSRLKEKSAIRISENGLIVISKSDQNH